MQAIASKNKSQNSEALNGGKISENRKNIQSHIAWLFGKNIVGLFGHRSDGKPQYGIYFSGIIFKDTLEKINNAGLEIEYIQPVQDDEPMKTTIIVVSERRCKI